MNQVLAEANRVAKYLSCLHGSEPVAFNSAIFHCFLSCLHGSEPYNLIGGDYADFLSCLHGSELDDRLFFRAGRFLSCLHGSELKQSTLIPLSDKPIPQKLPPDPFLFPISPTI
ncbi:hypothetical protein [Enterobacter hormaechei]|uniref:hypothetical protein n=1 Tax=Enterobacter hormaechei TaxID=158836 RepID=UPI003C6C3D63